MFAQVEAYRKIEPLFELQKHLYDNVDKFTLYVDVTDEGKYNLPEPERSGGCGCVIL